MGNKNFKRSAARNNLAYIQHLERAQNLCISSIGWRGLPDEIDEIFLEKTIFFYGKALFFYDEIIENFVVSEFTNNGELTIYNEPKRMHAYAANGTNWQKDFTNSIIIYENFMRTSLMGEAEIYANRMYEIDRTVDVNIFQQKRPYIIKVDENEVLSYKNMMMQLEGNQEAIFTTKGFSVESLQTVPSVAPYVADKLYILKRQYNNEFMTLCGIESANSEKSERLVSDEVASNISPSMAYREGRLAARRIAAKKISKMFEIPEPEPYFRYPSISDFETEVNNNEQPNNSIEIYS